MRIAVISDLHLGSGGASDSFGHDDSEFLRFLRFLEQNFERIVLLGDVWETLAGPRYGRPAAELESARDSHPEIARRFERPEYAYVHGNHDIVTGPLEGAPEELSIEADGVRLLFTHGHQSDPIVQRARWLSELGVWVGAWLRRAGLGPLYRLGRMLDTARGGATPGDRARDFQRWAVEVAALRRADVVVTGHTHVGVVAEHGDRVVLNSGSCSEGQISFLSIDTRTGRYAHHREW
jgi:predicted phosphodiesterase